MLEAESPLSSEFRGNSHPQLTHDAIVYLGTHRKGRTVEKTPTAILESVKNAASDNTLLTELDHSDVNTLSLTTRKKAWEQKRAENPTVTTYEQQQALWLQEMQSGYLQQLDPSIEAVLKENFGVSKNLPLDQLGELYKKCFNPSTQEPNIDFLAKQFLRLSDATTTPRNINDALADLEEVENFLGIFVGGATSEERLSNVRKIKTAIAAHMKALSFSSENRETFIEEARSVLNGEVGHPQPRSDEQAEKDQHLEVISDKDRFVPIDFKYGDEEILTEVLAALDEDKTYSEYRNNERLTLPSDEYSSLVSQGKLLEKLVGEPSARPKWFVDTDNRYVIGQDGQKIPKKGADNIQTWTPENISHYKLHPYAKQMLERGAFSGLGFYYRPEANSTADSVILREHNGKLQALLIDRGDDQGIAVPGGMVDPDELADLAQAALKTALRVAKRETGEEAKINLEGIENVPLLKDVIVGDPRATVQAWPETTVFLFMPDEATAAKLEAKEGDDAKKADWRWIDINQDMFASHKSYLMLGVQEWQRRRNRVVKKDGTIGIAP